MLDPRLPPDLLQHKMPCLYRSRRIKINSPAAATKVLAGAKIHGGTFRAPYDLAEKTFGLFEDFLVLDVRTGDGIVMATEEHYGPNWHRTWGKHLSIKSFGSAQNKVGTAPL